MPKNNNTDDSIEMQPIGHNRFVYLGRGGQFVQILFSTRSDALSTAKRLYNENREEPELAGNPFATGGKPPKVNEAHPSYQRFFPPGKPFFRIHISAYPTIQATESTQHADNPTDQQYLNLPVLTDLAHASTHGKQQEEKTTQTDNQAPERDESCTIL
jgi:hypothetical protein